jgi:deazaflavin-dependent oxidoreductase (nitroreductase family)
MTTTGTTAVTYAQAGPARRAVRRFAATRVGDWLFANVLRRLDGPVYRITSGRHTAANLLSGLPVVHLTTTGARTGRQRTVPVLGLPTPAGLAVIASNFGRAQQPGWYHNLRAHPGATVTVRGSVSRVRAVEARGGVREQIWRSGLEVFPGWGSYQQRAGREMAVFLLVPEDGARPPRHLAGAGAGGPAGAP